eukprot:1647877-Karenia_brevis.AAC.1
MFVPVDVLSDRIEWALKMLKDPDIAWPPTAKDATIAVIEGALELCRHETAISHTEIMKFDNVMCHIRDTLESAGGEFCD